MNIVNIYFTKIYKSESKSNTIYLIIQEIRNKIKHIHQDRAIHHGFTLPLLNRHHIPRWQCSTYKWGHVSKLPDIANCLQQFLFLLYHYNVCPSAILSLDERDESLMVLSQAVMKKWKLLQGNGHNSS